MAMAGAGDVACTVVDRLFTSAPTSSGFGENRLAKVPLA